MAAPMFETFSRRDGQAWVGTTALALLALLDGDRHPEPAASLHEATLAASVDETGKVLGNMTVASADSTPSPRSLTHKGKSFLHSPG